MIDSSEETLRKDQSNDFEVVVDMVQAEKHPQERAVSDAPMVMLARDTPGMSCPSNWPAHVDALLHRFQPGRFLDLNIQIIRGFSRLTLIWVWEDGHPTGGAAQNPCQNQIKKIQMKRCGPDPTGQGGAQEDCHRGARTASSGRTVPALSDCRARVSAQPRLPLVQALQGSFLISLD